jgi:ribosomal protein S18 acetylase RimI-like enzyme
MFVVKKITALETYPVRHQVLRKGKPIETCTFDGDNDATTMHFGLYENEKIIGIVSIYLANNHIFTDEMQFQIRGMAVLENFQGKGFGKQLILASENFCEEKKATLIWFNARDKAIPFYEKLGYESIGEAFEIPNIGIHFVMYKKI